MQRAGVSKCLRRSAVPTSSSRFDSSKLRRRVQGLDVDLDLSGMRSAQRVHAIGSRSHSPTLVRRAAGTACSAYPRLERASTGAARPRRPLAAFEELARIGRNSETKRPSSLRGAIGSMATP